MSDDPAYSHRDAAVAMLAVIGGSTLPAIPLNLVGAPLWGIQLGFTLAVFASVVVTGVALRRQAPVAGAVMAAVAVLLYAAAKGATELHPDLLLLAGLAAGAGAAGAWLGGRLRPRPRALMGVAGLIVIAVTVGALIVTMRAAASYDDLSALWLLGPLVGGAVAAGLLPRIATRDIGWGFALVALPVTLAAISAGLSGIVGVGIMMLLMLGLAGLGAGATRRVQMWYGRRATAADLPEARARDRR